MIQFVRRRIHLILTGLALASMCYWLLCANSNYRREKAIAESLSDHCFVDWAYRGPDWIPQPLRRHCPWFDRINAATLMKTHTDVELRQLQNLPYLEDLTLDFPTMTDARIEILQGMVMLKRLDLVELTSDEYVGISLFARDGLWREWHGLGSRVSTKDCERLQKALPYCQIRSANDITN